jgi:hypothetical protein
MRVWLGTGHPGVWRQRASPMGFLEQLQLGRPQACSETSRELWDFTGAARLLSSHPEDGHYGGVGTG